MTEARSINLWGRAPGSRGGLHPEMAQHPGMIDPLAVVTVKAIPCPVYHLGPDALGADIHIHGRIHGQCIDIIAGGLILNI